MDIKQNFKKIDNWLFEIPQSFRSDMNVPARIYTSEKMLQNIETNALNQLINSTTLPGIVKYAIAMPDIHSGYGPPIGGVGAMKLPDGVISPGFVGYDENCGIRLLKSKFTYKEIGSYLDKIGTEIQKQVPSGLGKGRTIKLSIGQINQILEQGVPKIVEQGYGNKTDVVNCEEQGKMKWADASCVSDKAKNRGRNQVGTLGSGNHFCEILKVNQIFDKSVARVFGLFEGQIVVMVHTGSRGLGHQNCVDYLKIVMQAMSKYKIKLPDRELACVPFSSPEGQRFFKAMSAVSNYAWVNRQMITYYLRMAWKKAFSSSDDLELLYDVAHNIAKIEEHQVYPAKCCSAAILPKTKLFNRVNGQNIKLIVHRKGATRAFPPNHPEIPKQYQAVGQPVLIPGTMGTASYVLAGTEKSKQAWHTVCHGAGRAMSRHRAIKEISGQQVKEKLNQQGIIIKSHSLRGIAEEAPMAYKDIDQVIEVVHQADLSKKVAKLLPLIIIKGE